MKNKLVDLNNHLFEALERLNDDDLTDTDDKLRRETGRAQALGGLASIVIESARLSLKAQLALDDGLTRTVPSVLGIKDVDVDEDEN